jgi:vacuolar-type H+-ATPase subunit I/STV1
MALPDSQPPRRPLPPHLLFLRKFSGPFPEDTREYIAHLRGLLAQVEAHRADILAVGIDPDQFRTKLEGPLAGLERKETELEEAVENLLQATADKADAHRKAFHSLDTVVQTAAEEQPFDPAVQDAKEFVEEMRKQMPKEL